MPHIANEVIAAADMNALEAAVAGIPDDVAAAVAAAPTVVAAAEAAVAGAGADTFVPRATAGIMRVDASSPTFGGLDSSGGSDNAAALAAAVTFALNAGGELNFPPGIFRGDSQISLDNDGATPAKQKPLRIKGAGAHFSGRGTAPVGGTRLDLRFSGTQGKIRSNGLGLLAVEGITFTDTAGTTTPWIYVTNTTPHIDQCGFVGSKTGVLCDQDCIVGGGTTAVEGGNGWDDGFQGYGAVISRNFFSGIRRAVYGRTFFNANVIRDNTIWATCGSNLTGGAAIELAGGPAVSGGNVIAGNLIEMVDYTYGILLSQSEKNTLLANNFYDPGAGVTAAYIRCDTGAQFNLIIAGFGDDAYAMLSETASVSGKNTMLSGHQNVATLLPGGARVSGNIVLRASGGTADLGYLGASGTELQTDLSHRATATQHKFGPATNFLDIGSLGTSDVWLDADGSNTDINVRIRGRGAGRIYTMTRLDVSGSSAPLNFTPMTTTARNTFGAGSAGAGGTVFDTTLNKLVTSDGSNWRDQAGTIV